MLAALKNAEIDKIGVLSESEEDAVVQKEIKQTKETLELASADRTDIIQECNYRAWLDILRKCDKINTTKINVDITIKT